MMCAIWNWEKQSEIKLEVTAKAIVLFIPSSLVARGPKSERTSELILGQPQMKHSTAEVHHYEKGKLLYANTSKSSYKHRRLRVSANHFPYQPRHSPNKGHRDAHRLRNPVRVCPHLGLLFLHCHTLEQRSSHTLPATDHPPLSYLKPTALNSAINFPGRKPRQHQEHLCGALGDFISLPLDLGTKRKWAEGLNQWAAVMSTLHQLIAPKFLFVLLTFPVVYLATAIIH